MAVVVGQATVTLTTAAGVATTQPVIGAFSPETLQVYAETKFTDLGMFMGPQGPDASRLKLVSGLLLEMAAGNPDLLVYVGTKDNINDTAVWAGPYTAAAGKIVNVREKARFFAFRVVDVAPTTVWELFGIKIFGRGTRGGSRR